MKEIVQVGDARKGDTIEINVDGHWSTLGVLSDPKGFAEALDASATTLPQLDGVPVRVTRRVA